MAASSALLIKSRAIFVRDARLAVSYNASFYTRFANIIVEVVILAFISSLIHPSARFGIDGRVVPYFSYDVINMAFVRFQTTSLLSFADAIRDGQLSGTLEVILATPTSLPTLVLSAGLWAFTLTVAQTIVFISTAALLGLDLSHAQVGPIVLFVALTIAAVAPIGVLTSAVTMTFKKTGPIELMMQSAAVLLGGVYLPVERLPHAMQIASWCLPITHALRGLRAAFQGASFATVAGDALWLSVAAALLLPISLAVFAQAVKRAKADGSLAHN
jgi:ABC-type multidrug transport system permease subunit